MLVAQYKKLPYLHLSIPIHQLSIKKSNKNNPNFGYWCRWENSTDEGDISVSIKWLKDCQNDDENHMGEEMMDTDTNKCMSNFNNEGMNDTCYDDNNK